MNIGLMYNQILGTKIKRMKLEGFYLKIVSKVQQYILNFQLKMEWRRCVCVACSANQIVSLFCTIKRESKRIKN